MTAATRAFVAVMLAGAALGGCGAPTAADEGRIAPGTWAGDHLRLDVSLGGAIAEYACAHGTIDEPLVPDRAGHFSASGTHTFEHGGPIRVDEPPNRHPARYEGRVVGDRLQLTITVTDTQQMVGDFTVIFGAASRLVKCL